MSFINIKTLVVIILSILFIYILIQIFRRIRHQHHHHHKEDNSKSNSKSKSKCGSLNCLDMYNYNECPCNKNMTKELFTMAQSVFPLHAPTLPAFSQILNENMANITDDYMEHTEAHPLTRDFPSQETSTGFFNVKGDALLSKKH